MSSLIGVIQGKIEVPVPQKRESVYYPQTMFVNRFYGGNGRGTSIQINIGNSHIQLDEKAADQLAEVLSNWKHTEEKDDY